MRHEPGSVHEDTTGAPWTEPGGIVLVYFTDRGIEELTERRDGEAVTVEWLAERLRDFVDVNPDFEVAIDRLATWLARDDSEDSDLM